MTKKLTLVIALLNLLPPAALAQSGSGMLEEVVVTARKRAENIQETPVAVTAITGADLRDRGIVNTDELAKSVPSLQINNGTTAQIFIRGIGQRSGLARQDPSVSVYLDGIFIPRADGQLLDTVDIESVQVLRGPQGTLFGKNNTGGALVFTLEKPGEERGGYVEGALGNYNAQRIRAGYSFPVTDRFSTRVAFNINQRDGYLEDLSGNDNQSVDRMSGILQTNWLMSDSLTLDTFAFFGKIRERYPSYNCDIVNEQSLFIEGLYLAWPGDTSIENLSAYRDNCEANNADNLPDLTTNQGSTAQFNKYINNLMMGATLNWEINDTHSLKTILGVRNAYKRGPQTQSDEGGPGEFQVGYTLGGADQDSYTFEFQLNGELFDAAIEYTAGFFWQDEYKSERFMTGDALVGLDASVLTSILAGQKPNRPPPGSDANRPILGAILPLNTVQDFDIDGQTAAIFAQATWHITENLEFSFGGRYTEEERDSTLTTFSADNAKVAAMIQMADPRFTAVDNATLPILGTLPGGGDQARNSLAILQFSGVWAQDPVGIANRILGSRNAANGFINTPLLPGQEDEREETFRAFTPMASLSWFVPPELLGDGFFNSMLVYGTWSNGFKSGFLEPSGVDGLIAVKPELLENREVGFKIDALQRSLRINLALYSMIFEDMQLITVDVDSASSLVVTTDNAGESMIEGGELEITWLPSPNWMLNFSYSNNNYKFEEFMDQDLAALAIEGRQVSIDRSDETFPVSPEVSASFGIQYMLPTTWGLFSPRLDFSYKDEIYLGFDDGSWEVRDTNRDAVYAPSRTLVDFRLNWQNNEGDLNVAAYIKNLTDERYFIGAVATGDSIGTFTQAIGEPRMYGIEIRKQLN